MRTWAAFMLLLLLMQLVSCQQSESNGSVELVFFWREGCPHCSDEKEFLAELEEKYPELVIKSYEAKQHIELFEEYAQRYNTTTQYVPVTFVGGRVIQGFNNRHFLGNTIESLIKREISKNKNETCQSEDNDYISVPFIGLIDPNTISLPVFTVSIGLLDGFNPCAMWVLMFLLTLLVHAKSRKRMLLIGGIFVISSGIIYFMFMAAWLNAFLYIGLQDWSRLLIGALAIAAGLINLKDFIWFKKGLSLTIPESAKPKLFERMRSVVNEKNKVTMIVGTAALAVFVNFIELACTAGFPAIYTRILTLRNLSPIEYYLYLSLYNIFYVLPLLVIVGVFVKTMGSRKLKESEGKILKLAGGIMMLALGLVMILAPELLTL
jgi:glutaredoxin